VAFLGGHSLHLGCLHLSLSSTHLPFVPLCLLPGLLQRPLPHSLTVVLHTLVRVPRPALPAPRNSLLRPSRPPLPPRPRVVGGHFLFPAQLLVILQIQPPGAPARPKMPSSPPLHQRPQRRSLLIHPPQLLHRPNLFHIGNAHFLIPLRTVQPVHLAHKKPSVQALPDLRALLRLLMPVSNCEIAAKALLLGGLYRHLRSMARLENLP
jgi:hypothetical protein